MYMNVSHCMYALCVEVLGNFYKFDEVMDLCV